MPSSTTHNCTRWCCKIFIVYNSKFVHEAFINLTPSIVLCLTQKLGGSLGRYVELRSGFVQRICHPDEMVRHLDTWVISFDVKRVCITVTSPVWRPCFMVRIKSIEIEKANTLLYGMQNRPLVSTRYQLHAQWRRHVGPTSSQFVPCGHLSGRQTKRPLDTHNLAPHSSFEKSIKHFHTSPGIKYGAV